MGFSENHRKQRAVHHVQPQRYSKSMFCTWHVTYNERSLEALKPLSSKALTSIKSTFVPSLHGDVYTCVWCSSVLPEVPLVYTPKTFNGTVAALLGKRREGKRRKEKEGEGKRRKEKEREGK